jgi:hypothetical protein
MVFINYVYFDRHLSHVQINQHKSLTTGKTCHHLMTDRYLFRIISCLLFTIDIRQGYFCHLRLMKSKIHLIYSFTSSIFRFDQSIILVLVYFLQLIVKR